MPGRIFALTLITCAAAQLIYAQALSPRTGAKDPGVRGGAVAAGGSVAGVSPALFQAAQAVFEELDTVSNGLGPSFNMNSCSGCHNFPASGGSSPKVNPQVAVSTLLGAQNILPAFIEANGPVREVRFKRNSDGTPDGGVHDLFVITGRSDAPAGCTLVQTDFATQAARGNVSFRVPTPTFGAGLIEAIPDSTILGNKLADAGLKFFFGISGHENRSGNDGSITRFGWKAQNKSLLIFAGEAYNVEQGVTNEAFPNARESSRACATNGNPEDHTDFSTGAPSDITQFDLFMRFLAPPTPVASYGSVSAASIQHGHSLFVENGCALCHTESLTTGPASLPALSNQPARLFSDLLVHNMGTALADGVSQGNAAGDEFRTAPLWGLGQRIFFLHDGRTSDLTEAIQAHVSSGSEGSKSVEFFNSQSDADKQDILNFLRSL